MTDLGKDLNAAPKQVGLNRSEKKRSFTPSELAPSESIESLEARKKELEANREANRKLLKSNSQAPEDYLGVDFSVQPSPHAGNDPEESIKAIIAEKEKLEAEKDDLSVELDENFTESDFLDKETTDRLAIHNLDDDLCINLDDWEDA